MSWLTYRKGKQVRIVIIRAASLARARMAASVARIDGSAKFAEGYEIDEQTARRVPKAILGRALTRQEAEQILWPLEKA